VTVNQRNYFKEVSDMKKKLMTGVVCLALALTFGCAKKADQSAQQNAGSILKATVSVVLGSATILRDSVPGMIKATVNMQLLPEDMVITGPASRLNLVIENSGVIQIGPESKVVMSSLLKRSDGTADQKMMVKAGKVILGLKKLQKDSVFDVETPTAVAGVRGTSFMVNVSEEQDNAFPYFVKLEDQKQVKTEVAVLAGAVELSGQKEGEKVMVNSLKMAILQGSDFANVKVVDIDRLYLNELQEVKGFAEIRKLQMDEITEEIATVEPQIKAVLKKDLKTSAEIKKVRPTDVSGQESKLQDGVKAQDKEIEKVKTKQKREGKYLDDGSAW
jgi:hypothetical protein